MLGSVWTLAQFDHSFRFELNWPPMVLAFFMRKVKTLIRLGVGFVKQRSNFHRHADSYDFLYPKYEVAGFRNRYVKIAYPVVNTKRGKRQYLKLKHH